MILQVCETLTPKTFFVLEFAEITCEYIISLYNIADNDYANNIREHIKRCTYIDAARILREYGNRKFMFTMNRRTVQYVVDYIKYSTNSTDYFSSIMCMMNNYTVESRNELIIPSFETSGELFRIGYTNKYFENDYPNFRFKFDGIEKPIYFNLPVIEFNMFIENLFSFSTVYHNNCLRRELSVSNTEIDNGLSNNKNRSISELVDKLNMFAKIVGDALTEIRAKTISIESKVNDIEEKIESQKNTGSNSSFDENKTNEEDKPQNNDSTVETKIDTQPIQNSEEDSINKKPTNELISEKNKIKVYDEDEDISSVILDEIDKVLKQKYESKQDSNSEITVPKPDDRSKNEKEDNLINSEGNINGKNFFYEELIHKYLTILGNIYETDFNKYMIFSIPIYNRKPMLIHNTISYEKNVDDLMKKIVLMYNIAGFIHHNYISETTRINNPDVILYRIITEIIIPGIYTEICTQLNKKYTLEEIEKINTEIIGENYYEIVNSITTDNMNESIKLLSNTFDKLYKKSDVKFEVGDKIDELLNTLSSSRIEDILSSTDLPSIIDSSKYVFILLNTIVSDKVNIKLIKKIISENELEASIDVNTFISKINKIILNIALSNIDPDITFTSKNAISEIIELKKKIFELISSDPSNDEENSEIDISLLETTDSTIFHSIVTKIIREYKPKTYEELFLLLLLSSCSEEQDIIINYIDKIFKLLPDNKKSYISSVLSMYLTISDKLNEILNNSFISKDDKKQYINELLSDTYLIHKISDNKCFKTITNCINKVIK